jgi:hypothetical protein
MKRVLLIVVIALFLVGCDQKWEYKVVHFDRTDYLIMDAKMQDLGNCRWEYVGPLTNDGLNAHFILFKRPEKSTEWKKEYKTILSP